MGRIEVVEKTQREKFSMSQFIAMNRFKIVPGMESEFEGIWKPAIPTWRMFLDLSGLI